MENDSSPNTEMLSVPVVTISQAVRKGFRESGLASLVSDEGAAGFYAGLQGYTVAVIASFMAGKRMMEHYAKERATLAKLIDSYNANFLLAQIQDGDTTLFRGTLQSDSGELAAKCTVAYGTASELLKQNRTEYRFFALLSLRSRQMLEGMLFVGRELGLAPKTPTGLYFPFGQFVSSD